MDEQSANDEIDRDEWYRRWRECSHRVLQQPPKIKINDLDVTGAKLLPTTITNAPAQYADRLRKQHDLCPVCGESTAGEPRLSASLWVTIEYPALKHVYSQPLSYGMAVWVHVSCWLCCPLSDEPSPVPW